MLERPDKRALLERVARFLEEEAKPALQDPALSYRAILAASLVRQVAAEVTDERARSERELARLRELVPDGSGDLTRALVERIRARTVDAKRARALVREMLEDELAVTNPRFDPEARVE